MNFEGLSEKLDGFNRYYESDLRPLLAGLEVRRKAARKNLFTAAIPVVMIVVGVFIITQNNAMSFVAMGVGLLIIGYFVKKLSDVKREAKLSVLPILCDYLEFDYSHSPRLNKLRRFRDLSILPSYDEEKREDEVSGSLTEVDFWLQETKLVRVTRTKKSTKRTTVFKGLLCHFDFHKNFMGTTIGKKDYSAIGNFFADAFTSGERVKLEDPDFEDKFQVYATDQIEARYLLTPGFMQRLLDLLNASFIKNIQFAFDDGKLFMSLESSKKFFEGGDNELDDPEYVLNIIRDISLVFDIVKTLNLTQETKV